MSVHIYTTNWQPATCYRVPGMSGFFTHSPGSLVFTDCCRKRRRSVNVEVQVYYDMTRARCIDGKGCR